MNLLATSPRMGLSNMSDEPIESAREAMPTSSATLGSGKPGGNLEPGQRIEPVQRFKPGKWFAARMMQPFCGRKAKIHSKSDDPRNIDGKIEVELEETQLGVRSDASATPPENSGSHLSPMSFTYSPGSTPLPPYTIRRGVGVGGFGEVYFAISAAGKEVALKRIQRNLDVELRGVSQCLNLKHPNLVSLYDICQDPDSGSWVVMEFVSGQNLRDLLDQHPNGLPEAEARRWFAGIAAGVDHLHNAGLVHRDLKPGNVFDDLGTVKVGDYGLSKFISSSQRGGHTESVGTFHYMAPEIGRGQYGREIDVYALGIVLYELLTGKVPFDGESCHEIIVKHMTAVPDLHGVQSPYRETIARALDKDPNKRPGTVAEMIAPLRLVASEAVALPTLSMPGQVTMPGLASSEPAGIGHSIGGRREPVARLVSDFAPGAAQPLHEQAGSFGQVAGSAVAGSAMTGSAMTGSASPVNRDEPLLRAIKASAKELSGWWRSLDQSPRTRFLISAMVAFVLFVNTSWLLPVLSILGAVYVPYYVIRQMVLHGSEQPSYARANQLASQVVPPPGPKTKAQWRQEVRRSLKAKHNVVRLAELNSSWIASSLTVFAMAVAAGIMGLRSGDVGPLDLAPYFWIAIVVLIGAQGILGLGKLWERDEGEGLPRRLVLAGVGAGVGLAAFGLNEFFMLPNQPGPNGVFGPDLPQALYREDGSIRAAGMMAHFALLLGGIRWWKPVDPLRRTRLSLWSVAVTCVAAWGLQLLLPVPQPFGILVAGGLSVATQMSAPWINPKLVQPAHLSSSNRSSGVSA